MRTQYFLIINTVIIEGFYEDVKNFLELYASDVFNDREYSDDSIKFDYHSGKNILICFQNDRELREVKNYFKALLKKINDQFNLYFSEEALNELIINGEKLEIKPMYRDEAEKEFDLNNLFEVPR